MKGGIRAVTGYIGKRNREAYKVNTAVATIGIRGTGHNTRICEGDCPGKKNGLYHSTWEGETTVENDVDVKSVPAGSGVYVEDLESQIKSLSQPDGVTAVETARREKEEQEEDEESGALVSTGNQRSGEDGLQTIVVEDQEVIDELANPFGDPTFSEVDGGLVLQAVLPDVDDPEGVNAPDFFDVSVFSNSDGKPIAIVGTEEDDDEVSGNTTLLGVFATIDPAAALGVNDPAVASEVEQILAAADPDQIDFFLEKPAEVAEFHATPEGLSVARWSNGHILSVDKDLATGEFKETNVDVLTGNQSLHFIFGEEPGPITSTGSALYQFTVGTNSTSISGDTIGDGATNGFISVTFSTSDAFLQLDVEHAGSQYMINGNLMIDGASLQDTNVFATTSTNGSACNPVCPTFVDGGFAGPDAPSMPGMPNNIGIEYDIQDTDVITGVAGFSYELVGP